MTGDRHRLQRYAGLGGFRGMAALFLGTLSGGLYWAAIPRLDWGFLAWICLLPCLVVARGMGIRATVIAASIAGLLAATGRCYWIAPTLHLYGDVPPGLALATAALLIIYLAIYWLIFVRAYRALPQTSLFTPWLTASLWVLLEWASEWMLSGFPWELLGYTQHRFLWLVQTASVTGVYGLSFLIAWVNASLAQLLFPRVSPSRAAALMLPPAALLAALCIWGHHRLEFLEREPRHRLHVGIVQGAICQDRKWRPGQRTITTTRYVDLATQLPADSLDLIILPETALPFYLEHPANAVHRRRLQELARTLNAALLVGSLGGTWETGGYNRAFLFDRKGKLRDFADKVHLVPFGEYLPFPRLFGYLHGLVAESGSFRPGAGHKALHLPATQERLGIFICFESVFPEITRHLVELGATVLVTITNDAWFGLTAAPAQHFSMAVLRAVETGRDVIRVANTGISGSISASGRVQQTTALFAPVSLTVHVVPRREITPYVQYGDWILVCSAALLLLYRFHGLIRAARQIRRDRQQARADLQAYARSPRPLPHPVVLVHGYRSHPECWLPLVEQLHRCSTNATQQILAPQLDENAGIPQLAARLATSLSTCPVDWVGHSMGGLVAMETDAQRAQTEGRILLLASPLRGTWAARIGFWLHLPGRPQLRDMATGSMFIRRLDKLLARLGGNRVHAWFAPGDLLVPRRSALVPQATAHLHPYPWSAGPLARHGQLCTDVRILRDIIALLQNRPGLESSATSLEGTPRSRAEEERSVCQ